MLPVEHPLNPVSGWLRDCDGTRQMSFRFIAAKNCPVRAATAGKVVFVGLVWRLRQSNYNQERQPGFPPSTHIVRKTLVSRDAQIMQGQEIALVGRTGFVHEAQPILHFEIRTGRSSGPTRKCNPAK